MELQDDSSIGIEFPLDLSKDYHPLVEAEEYDLQQVDNHNNSQNSAVWSYRFDNAEKTSYRDVINELMTI
ncbi:hypothetical protein INT48_008908 [Thamnidium elegans]|uniref:Uncharacterized protein n=1 Tax=Thamnidium elegans TaxID=101142 RepID=A0A8H7SPD8_9FUNG|nr:hypothetical protein INT48_008908 [Thamnidium elegans]